MPLEWYHTKKFEFNLILYQATTNFIFCSGAVGKIKTFFKTVPFNYKICVMLLTMKQKEVIFV